MYLFDVAKDLLDSTTPASSNGVAKTSDKGASAKSSVLRRRSSDSSATKDGKKAEKQHPDSDSKLKSKRASTSSTHLRKSSLMVDVMTGEFLDDLLDDSDEEDRNDKF